ncbi:MAG: SWF/SNF helicase family protein [Planctomycetes bacterium]|nr:SWF/SNF helicase family protein [Planctomycetota bacterium]
MPSSNDQPELFTETNLAEADKVLSGDKLFQAIVVQRSRAYVRQSKIQEGSNAANFPTRDDPNVADYSVKKTYGKLLGLVEQAFSKEKPLFSLAMYYPLAFYQGPDTTVDRFAENRQKQVVGLIRIQFLKRFESSAHAFKCSCDRLLVKLLTFVTKHSETKDEKKHLEKWLIRHKDLTKYVQERYESNLYGEAEEEADEDLITDEMLENVAGLDREQYDVPSILRESLEDLETLADFLEELENFQPQHDDKLKALIKLLKADKDIRNQKVLIFTEFADTARYLRDQLIEAGLDGVEEIDSATKKDRGDVITRFSPYYNGSNSAELATNGKDEIRILISTDILSEGLNLQDAARLINYDLHWNPVRLMQRIGRVDRRLNPEVEANLLADHPDQKSVRGKVMFWNFLPPEELEELLRLFRRVSHKVLRISRKFGIEGQKLLHPEDDYEALKNFNHAYEGEPNPQERMHLEFQELLKEHPGLAERLSAFPGRVFSGKAFAPALGRAVFFCYALPAPNASAAPSAEPVWTEEAGITAWYLYDMVNEKISQDPMAIIDLIRSKPETPRHCVLEQKTLADIRGRVERHIKNTYLKSMQAPQGVKPVLKAWMELT